jgi:GTPase
MPTPPAPRKKKAAPFRAGRVAILGRPNVGKSTLLNALVGERIAITSSHPQTTRDQIRGIFTDEDAQLVFIDTPGVHRARTKLGARMNQLARDATRDCEIVFFMTDLAPGSGSEMREVDRVILAQVPAKTPVILVLNKSDKMKDKTKLFPILEGYAKAHPFAEIVPMSARKQDSGVRHLLEAVKKLLPVGEKIFPDDELSDRPVRFFVSEMVREQILAKTRDEVPHGIAVTVERFDEAPRVPHISATIHVDREGHKKIVIGEKGAVIKAVGQGARKRIEELVGRQVHLELWVRVTPRWYESDAQLKDMGYGADEG